MRRCGQQCVLLCVYLSRARSFLLDRTWNREISEHTVIVDAVLFFVLFICVCVCGVNRAIVYQVRQTEFIVFSVFCFDFKWKRTLFIKILIHYHHIIMVFHQPYQVERDSFFYFIIRVCKWSMRKLCALTISHSGTTDIGTASTEIKSSRRKRTNMRTTVTITLSMCPPLKHNTQSHSSHFIIFFFASPLSFTTIDIREKNTICFVQHKEFV